MTLLFFSHYEPLASFVFMLQGRTHIFKIHARSMSVERDIRFELLARLCPNSTGKLNSPSHFFPSCPNPLNSVADCMSTTTFLDSSKVKTEYFPRDERVPSISVKVEIDLFFRCGDPQCVHGGRHVCHQSPQEDCNRERLS